uniref:C2orf72-like C-terminal domain-containing protein n=1 Tax=Crocodylus porosus TaxID=8502 RepID=A0A7M4EG32_CROPO
MLARHGEGDFQVLVEKVGGKPDVLLIGEALTGDDTRALMKAFVQELFPDALKPSNSLDKAMTQMLPGAEPGFSKSQSQLIFFLCRASCLQNKQAEIQEVLKEVKKYTCKAPAALVGIVMQPKKNEEAQARKLMETLLWGVFPRQPLQVEVEIFIPGQPRGKLAIMKAACRAAEALKRTGVKQDGPCIDLCQIKAPVKKQLFNAEVAKSAGTTQIASDVWEVLKTSMYNMAIKSFGKSIKKKHGLVCRPFRGTATT